MEECIISTRMKKIEEEILNLPPQERALLAEHLLNSLDEDEDPEAEKLWIAEAERRYQAFKQGKVKGIPADKVFREVRSKFA